VINQREPPPTVQLKKSRDKQILKRGAFDGACNSTAIRDPVRIRSNLSALGHGSWQSTHIPEKQSVQGSGSPEPNWLTGNLLS